MINQSTLIYGERKKERSNFYGMFSQSLPISIHLGAVTPMADGRVNNIKFASYLTGNWRSAHTACVNSKGLTPARN